MPGPRRRIEYVALDDLQPAEQNPKNHADTEIDASLDRFGYTEPVLLDERTGRLVAGHGRIDRLKARRAAGDPPPDGVIVAKGGVWKLPVVRGWASRDDDEAAAYLVASNRLVEAGGWDTAGLVDLLDTVAASPGGLDGIGYTPDDLDVLLASLADHEPAPDDEDDEASPVDPPQITATGDVWVLGGHRVMCGDCRNPDHVAMLLNGATVNLAVTSPPYADRRKYDESTEFRPIPPDEYVEWFAPVAGNVAAHLTDDGSWLVNIRAGCEDGERLLYVFDLVIAHQRAWGWKFVDDFCWVDSKNGVPGGWPNRFKDAWEPVFHFSRSQRIKFHPFANGTQSDAVFDYSPDTAVTSTGSGLLGMKATPERDGIARPSNVVTLAASSSGDHPASFPVALPAWFVRAFTDPGDVVFDPFVGSGSTILAAHQHDRVGYGMELSPRYVDVICARFQRATGIVPQRPDGTPVDFSG